MRNIMMASMISNPLSVLVVEVLAAIRRENVVEVRSRARLNLDLLLSFNPNIPLSFAQDTLILVLFLVLGLRYCKVPELLVEVTGTLSITAIRNKVFG
jgi:hypothetical protein